MTNCFPRLSSIINNNIDYPRTDIRNKLLQSLEFVPAHFQPIEAALQGIDESNFEFLKVKLLNCCNKYNKTRGWQQFFDVLTEAQAYAYLKNLNYKDIKFVPPEKVLTPDLRARSPFGHNCYLEVKNIGKSDAECFYLMQNFEKPKVRNVVTGITDKFKTKIIKTIDVAKKQLLNYQDSDTDAERIIYLNINPDLHVWLSSSYRDLEQFMSEVIEQEDTVKIIYFAIT